MIRASRGARAVGCVAIKKKQLRHINLFLQASVLVASFSLRKNVRFVKYFKALHYVFGKNNVKMSANYLLTTTTCTPEQ